MRTYVYAGFAFALLAMTASVACKTDTKDLEQRIAAVEQQQTGLGTQIQNVAMLGALQALGNAELHDLSMAVEDGQIPDGAGGAVNAALVAVAATAWPADLAPAADDLQAKLQALLDALVEGNPVAAAGPAVDAHEAYHEFNDSVSSMISSGAGLDGGEMDHGETATPAAATATPMG